MSNPRLTIEVENSFGKIIGLDHQETIDDLGKMLSYVNDQARYSFAVKMGHWDGRTRLLTRKLEFPAGLLAEVRNFLLVRAYEIDVIDHRINLDLGSGLDWTGPTLRDYQQNAVDKALAEGRGMMKLATGAGKTNIITALVGAYNTHTIVYVVSLDLLTQVRETLKAGLSVPIGMIGDGVCEIEKINVVSVWSAASAFNEKYKTDEEDVKADTWKPSDQQKKDIRDLVEGAKLIILDEAQFAAADSIQTLIKKSESASHRFGFSGTPWRSDGADILLTAAFGRNIVDVRASDLIKTGWLVPPRIAFKSVPERPDIKKEWATVKSEYIVNNAPRNQILIDGLNKMLDLGRKPLVLFRDLKHGKILESMLPNDVKYRVITGALALEEREEIKDLFKEGKLDLLLASSVFDQGVDLPALDGLILAGGGKSTAKSLQRIGRVIRSAPGKTDALVLETWDQCHFVKRHSQMRLDAYGWESEFVVSTQHKKK